ncbi:hypothetical protein [Paraburkholderia sp. C35]|uniref:hypothetical protein n=1 Tax=Paraburkholderia sp. C35 TaxID=2126993 RepID=UPI000D6959C5|nr:hypothetical protein [Paraburkholderia sp. C35]
MKTHKKQITAGWLVVIGMASAVLAGCSSGPSKGDLKDGLAEFFKAKPQDVCWNVENSAAVQWPIRIALQGMDKGQIAILNGVKASGVADITEAPNVTAFGTMGTVLTITLTEKGKDAKAWDPQKGFCVGTKQVKDVTEFTEPGKDGENVTDVKFTWQLDDLPSWVDRSKFPAIVGMTEPVADETLMQKTNNGWRVQ